MKKEVKIYTTIVRTYFVDAETNEQAVELAYDKMNDYDDEVIEECVRVEGEMFDY